MTQINLIPDVKRDLLRAQAIRNFVIFISVIAGGASIAIVFIAFGIFGGLLITTGLNESNIKSKFETLSKTSDIDETIIVQSQLSEISKIQKNAPRTSRLMNQIISAIHTKGANEVQFSSVNYNPSTRTVTIEGQTKNGYSALEGFKKTVRETKILYRETAKKETCTIAQAENGEDDCIIANLVADGEDVNVTESSLAEDESGEKVLRFSVNFNLNEKALVFETKNFAVKSPSKKEVTDSKTVISDDIFTVKASTEGEKNG